MSQKRFCAIFNNDFCVYRLVLPLVIRQTVNITNSGYNFTETTDLSTFGFLYGTFPAAPGVFVVATRYNTDIDLVKLKNFYFQFQILMNLIIFRSHLRWSPAPSCQHR